MAVLLISLGASLALSRGDAKMKGVAEDIVATIREAQNRAISTTPDRFGDENVKAWKVALDSTSYNLIGMVPDSANPHDLLTDKLEKENLLPNGMVIENISNTDFQPIITQGLPIYINFTTPFGKSYQSPLLLNEVSDCNWSDGSASGKMLPTKEYFPQGPNCKNEVTSVDLNPSINISGSETAIYYRFRLKYQNKYGPIVKIYTTGDVSLEDK